MEIKLQGFDRLQRGFDRAPDLTTNSLNAWMNTVTEHLRGQVQEGTPTDTYTLRNSMISRVEKSGTFGVVGIVGTAQEYARPVESGRKPYKPMNFNIAGRPLRAVGAFMFKNAFESNQQQIQDSFTRMVDNVLAKIAAGAT